MNRSYRTILLAFCLAGAVWGAVRPAAAQSETAPMPPKAPVVPTPVKFPESAAGPARIEEIPLETTYLRDGDGRLILVHEVLTFEEWLELLRMHRKLEAPHPLRRYSLLSMNLRGPVKEGLAQLKASFRIKLLVDGWARIPLRLNSTFLVKEAIYRGDGAYFMDFSKEGDGYAVWIRGGPDTLHVIELDLLAHVEELGGESRLLLQTPKVTTARLDLTVPSNEVDAQVEGGDIQAVKKQGANTLLQMIGLSGEFRLTWRDRRRPAAPLVTEARTHIRVEFDGKHHTRSEARILVHALNGAVESFVVRLPSGMRLVPHEEELSQRRYRATTLTEERRLALQLPAPDPRDGDLVEVQLQRKSSEPVEVALRAVKLRNDNAENATQPSLVEASGFEVIGAAHQWGYIDVALESEWNAHWIEQNVVRQDNIPADVRQSGVAARFAFSQQPCSLKVRVTPKATRVRVEPIYLLYVGDRDVRLESRLLYRIRGASDVRIDLADWQVDGVTPDNLIQANQTDFETTNPLTIVLSPLTQEAKDELELRVMARQTLPAEGPFSLRLPQLQATASAPATVVVLPADNIKLTPLPEIGVGLDQEPLPPQLELPERSQAPLYYRVTNSDQQAVFAGQIELRRRAVNLSAEAQIDIGSEQTRVRQQFAMRIAHEPLSTTSFWAPASVIASGSLQFLLEGQPLSYQLVGAESDSADATVAASDSDASHEGMERIELDLAGSRLEECVVEASYALPTPPAEAQGAVEFLVPLLLPADDAELTVAQWRVTAQADDHIQLDLAPSTWRASADMAPVPASLSARSETPVSITPFRLTYASREAGAMVIEKAWLQTWLSQQDRRDRAVFRFQSAKESIQVVLPPQADADTVIAAVDGNRTDYRIENDGQTLLISLPSLPETDDRVLELWYGFRGRPSVNGLMKINAPRVKDSRRVDRFYWQLCLPQGEHLVAAPGGLTAELTWRWRGLHWGRHSNLSQRDLEDWIDASRQADLPAASNQYLFSSFASNDTITIYTMQRRWALLIASLVALGVGLTLVYAPLLRHPASLLAGALLLGLVALFYPDTALLAAQAASIGLALAATAYLIDWGVAGRRPARPIVHSVSQQPHESRAGGPGLRSDSDSKTAMGAAIGPEASSEGEES